MPPNTLYTCVKLSVYNRLKRGLFFSREQLRSKIANCFFIEIDNLIVDSMPLEVCRLGRSMRSSICKEYYQPPLIK